MKGQRATKGKSAADKIYDKIEDKLQDKLRSEIPTENSSPPARPFASYDPGHGWPKLFAGYDSSGRKFWAQFSDSHTLKNSAEILTQNCGAQFLVVNIGNRRTSSSLYSAGSVDVDAMRLIRLYSIVRFELIRV